MNKVQSILLITEDINIINACFGLISRLNITRKGFAQLVLWKKGMQLNPEVLRHTIVVLDASPFDPAVSELVKFISSNKSDKLLSIRIERNLPKKEIIHYSDTRVVHKDEIKNFLEIVLMGQFIELDKVV